MNIRKLCISTGNTITRKKENVRMGNTIHQKMYPMIFEKIHKRCTVEVAVMGTSKCIHRKFCLELGFQIWFETKIVLLSFVYIKPLKKSELSTIKNSFALNSSARCILPDTF